MKKLALVITILSLLSVNLLGPAVSANAYTKLCEVDIGDPLSEAGHNLQSWGPIEPDAHPSPPPNDAWSGLSGNARVIWGYNEGTPCATLTLDRHLADGVARMIRLTFLDGIHYADLISDDSFTMEVKSNGAPDTEYQQVFAHTGGFTRQWLTVDIDLAPATNLDANGLIDVRLCATGPQWGFFGSDLGQAAFDRIELWGEQPVPIAECGDCEGGVTWLTLQYNGAATADIVVKAGKKEVFAGTVEPGGLFDVIGVGKDGKLGKEIKISVNGGPVIKIHTSCSKPVGPGLVAGDFEVIAGESLKGGPLCPIPPPPPPSGECDGGVTWLTLQYNGAATADIVVKAGKKEVFAGTVEPGRLFDVIGVGKNGKLGKEIKISVNGGPVIKIHTSCSQPIGVGMSFGDFYVVAGESLDGGPLSP